MQKDQLAAIYGEEAAEIVLQQTLAWRAMHSQGRGLNSVMINQLGDDIDTYTLREAEFSCNAIVGFNFGDGHLHDQPASSRRSSGAAASRPASSSSSGSSPSRSAAGASGTG